MTPEQKKLLAGRMISLVAAIPGKESVNVFCDIEDGGVHFFRGEKQEMSAYVDVRFNGECDFKYKQNFTKKVYEMFENEWGIEKEFMYLTILEYPDWGARGILKKL